GLLVGLALRKVAKADRNYSIAPDRRGRSLTAALSPADANGRLARHFMQKLIFLRCAIPTVIIALTTGAHAQGPAPSPLISLPSPPPAKVPAVAPQPSPAPALTRQDFETFLDALIPSQLQNRDIAGAVVSVVKDGQVLFTKGYGYADFTAKKPVLADQTLFRPGSISKLFTAAAVMQL